MLSYRHAYHAGNHADVFKHAVLVRLLLALQEKPAPLCWIDSHAGAGRYDLRSRQAQLVAEADTGIQRLAGREADFPELADWFRVISELNPHGDLVCYPGSPEIVRHLLREDDRLILMELHPADGQALKQVMHGDRRVGVHLRDGFEGVAAMVPPKPARGVLLVDPPYERREEYALVVDLTQRTLKRWSTGIQMIWLPLLARRRDRSRELVRGLGALPFRNLLLAELSVSEQADDAGMHGSAILIANAPWQFDAQLKGLVPRLHQTLSLSARSSWSVRWLIRPP